MKLPIVSRIIFIIFIIFMWGGTAFGQNEPSGSGTGFFVNSSGWLVTNAHVVDGCESVSVTGYGKALRLVRDQQNDLAAIKVTVNENIIPVYLSAALPRLGEQVLTLGFPLSGLLSESLKLSTGDVSSLAGINNDSRYLQFSAPIQLGNSGGPLLNYRGQMIGVVTATLGKKFSDKFGFNTQNVNFAINASVVARFLQSNSVPFSNSAPSEALQSAADVAEKLATSIVQILCFGKSEKEKEPDNDGSPNELPSSDNSSDAEWLLAIYQNVDFWGGDKYPKGLEIKEAEECATTCAQDLSCKLFTYNVNQKRCFIKTKLDIVVSTDGLVSGAIFANEGKAGGTPKAQELVSDFVSESGVEFTGFIWPHRQPDWRISSIDECLRYCSSDRRCQFLTFNPRNEGRRSCTIRWQRISGLQNSKNATSFRRHRVTLYPAGEVVPLQLDRQ